MTAQDDDRCPCMDPSALPRQISVGEHRVGIVGLTETIKAVRDLGLSDEEQIKRELLERVKKRNWVPEEASDKYAAALFGEYKRD